jgi:hypothetical protein
MTHDAASPRPFRHGCFLGKIPRREIKRSTPNVEEVAFGSNGGIGTASLGGNLPSSAVKV